MSALFAQRNTCRKNRFPFGRRSLLFPHAFRLLTERFYSGAAFIPKKMRRIPEKTGCGAFYFFRWGKVQRFLRKIRFLRRITIIAAKSTATTPSVMNDWSIPFGAKLSIRSIGNPKTMAHGC